MNDDTPIRPNESKKVDSTKPKELKDYPLPTDVDLLERMSDGVSHRDIGELAPH